MGSKDKKTDETTQANDNSVAVGKFSADRNTGNIHIGNIVYNTPPPEVNQDFTREKIEIADFEPETILIPAGSFSMGSDPGDNIKAYERPRHEVTLPVYRIGKYPVTNLQYRDFLLDSGFKVSPIIWDGQMTPAEELWNHPVAGVTWDEAMAYCQWLSKTGHKYTLPNEAQWEKACRGGKESLYPWGGGFDEKRCNQGSSHIAPVTKYLAQNEFGCFDMVGNVLQWTCTLWGPNPASPKYLYPWNENDRRNDPKPRPGNRRVIRGSSNNEGKEWCRCSARRGADPTLPVFQGARCGFRVVMNP